jgi:hypothetical protein
MRDHAPTPLPIDTPDDPPPLTEWSPAPSHIIRALFGTMCITLIVIALGLTLGFGVAAAFWAAVLLVFVVGVVWALWWPSDGRLASVLRWWL